MSGRHKGDCCGDPWPQLMIACARVVEIYSKIFDKPELLKISKCLKGVCRSCTCKARIKEEGEIFGYSFLPEGLCTKEEVEKFFGSFDEDNIPKLGSKGDEVRKEKILKQNPSQDDNLGECKFVGVSSKGSFEEFLGIRRDSSGKGVVKSTENGDKTCWKCKEIIPSGTLFVTTEKLVENFWHPSCFTCEDCGEFLQDLRHSIHDGSLLCGRHHAEKLRPRCSTCDELIFNETCTRAMGKNWHVDHFWCKDCNVILTGKKYAQKEGKPYCLECYESSFGKTCEKCKKSIGTDTKYLIYKKKHWHESCFACKLCHNSLVGKEFISNNEEIYCESCHEEKVAPRCDSCSKTFKFNAKTIEYKNKRYHDHCFVCTKCHVSIATKKFASKQEEIFCDSCYHENFGTKCTKCLKAIKKGGVTYRKEPWHNECFTCTNCPILLSGVTFTSHEDKPYCAGCFGVLFAKRCFACREPINGEGAKYINYDSHHWHNNCFFCSKCRCNLGGRRFVMEEGVILCPSCARFSTKEK